MSIIKLPFLAFLVILGIMYYLYEFVLGRCKLSKYRYLIILAGSIWFYQHFSIKHCLFLLFSVITVYAGALLIERSSSRSARKAVLAVTLILNIGTLAVVKYLPYTASAASKLFAIDTSFFENSWIVPVGISFYTLSVCGYCIDVYRNKYPCEKNIFKFATFATFFPLILQGPISRYDRLSKTLFKEKSEDIYSNITYGAQLMIWGFFKKLVIADRVSAIANLVFDNWESYTGLAIIVGIAAYTLQIYADFSGCVDICRGASQLFGIDVEENFNQPYFATSIQDFWKRWHMSLSGWLRDYLYIPLGGNRKGKVRKYINVVIVFFASGLWHGVGIHYIVWGLLQAVFQIIGALTLNIRTKLCSLIHIDRKSSLSKCFQIFFTFILINISWLFFRANGLTSAFGMIRNIFVSPFKFEFITSDLLFLGMDFYDFAVLVLSVILMFAVSYYKYHGMKVRETLASRPVPVRWAVYIAGILAVLVFGIYGPGYSANAFIYMNF